MRKFEWDENKAENNIDKHNNVTFDEAKTVFYDENALLITDPDHSIDEERFIILGLSAITRILVVCHCYRIDKDGNEIIRIFSARKANDEERKMYERKL